MKLYKLFLLSIAFMIAISSNSFAQVYEIEPKVEGCVKGKLSSAEITKIMNLINKMRKHHKLGEIPWLADKENISQSAALSMLATGIMSHGSVTGKCSDADSDLGRKTSNLSMAMSTANSGFSSQSHIIGWLIDNHSQTQPHSVGHRRVIINPYLKGTCLGKANGKHPTNTNWYLGAATLYGIEGSAMQKSTCENDFVAYPYENYPPEWVDKKFYLSFNPIADPDWWWGNNNKVKFENTEVKMTTEDGKPVNVHDVVFDYESWGCLVNNLSWKADNLQDNVKYIVQINNVIVNGATRNYTYWFKLTNEGDQEDPVAKAPKLVSPANGTEDIDLTNPVTFSWEAAQNIAKYEIQISENNEFTYIYDNKEVTGTSVAISSLTPGNKFFWRVAGFDSNLNPHYSETWWFTTSKKTIEPPVIVYPKENETDVARRENYIWNKVDDAKHYKLQIAKDENFSDGKVVVDQDKITETSYYLTDEQSLEANTDYYWRLAAVLPSGVSTSWTKATKFTTGTTYSSINTISQIDYALICPNPANNKCSLIGNLTEDITHLQLLICDLTGKIIEQFDLGKLKAGNFIYTFDVSKLTSGSYNMILKVGDKTKTEKLFISR